MIKIVRGITLCTCCWRDPRDCQVRPHVQLEGVWVGLGEPLTEDQQRILEAQARAPVVPLPVPAWIDEPAADTRAPWPLAVAAARTKRGLL